MAATDRIEKKSLLRAPLGRVWRAIADADNFGAWFGVRFDGPFAPGAELNGTMVGTTVDPEVARRQEAHKGVAFHVLIDRIEPMRLFSFHWHPYAVDSAIDYSKEPTTLVTFELAEAPGGTMLTVTESGFDRIPLERRAKAFASNTEGWAAQLRMIEKYLALHTEG